MVSIHRYGSYVPFFRLQRSAIGSGRGERAVASYDEDSISMAVEASREALRGADTQLDRLVFASVSPPYAEKLNAATVHAALDLPIATAAHDSTGSTRSGVAALGDALDAAGGGRTTLVAASDVMVGAPGGARETGSGDAAAAFVVGPGDGAAKLVGRASSTVEVLDSWRTPSMQFAQQWEERFGAEVFVPLFTETIGRALSDAGLEPGDISAAVLDATNARVLRPLAKTTGLSEDSFVGADFAAEVGRCGSAHAGLLLASVLDQAKPGDRVLVGVCADGVDVLIFEVQDGIEAARPAHSVAQWRAAKRDDLAYTSYLKWRGILPFEPPRRPDPERPAAPPMRRAERWKYAFVGSRCTACSGVNLPPQRVCVVCQAVDQTEDAPYADQPCRIATYTIDRLAYSLQPPIVAAVVDFAGGGRLNCQLTDVDPEGVGIGDELEMTFRRFFTSGGVHNYFWKARPQR